MGAITNDWLAPLRAEFAKPYYKDLYQKVLQEYRTVKVFPPADDIFNAFHLTPLSEVKVVILGQDPFQCEPRQIHSIPILASYLNGICVYRMSRG